MMKKIAIYAAAFAALVACNKEMGPSAQSESVLPQEERMVEVTLNAIGHGITTKAVVEDTADEAKVNNVQFFVFRANEDELEVCTSAAMTTQTISCTAGKKDVIALINAPQYQDVSTRTELLAKISELKNNTRSNFEMIGEAEDKDMLKTGDAIAVAVDRIASRIVIKKITKNFTSPALQALEFSVDRIYLINAAGNSTYSDKIDAFDGTNTLRIEPLKWYNIAKANDGDLADANVKSLVYNSYIDAENSSADYTKKGHVIANSGEGNPAVEWMPNLSLYAYPNENICNADGTDIPSADADAKHVDTRLVVEATVGVKKYFYSITMPQMDSNKSYEIENLTITRTGSEDPNLPTVFYDGEFSITVNDWTLVKLGEAGDGNIQL